MTDSTNPPTTLAAIYAGNPRLLPLLTRPIDQIPKDDFEALKTADLQSVARIMGIVPSTNASKEHILRLIFARRATAINLQATGYFSLLVLCLLIHAWNEQAGQLSLL
jgi:hypothetical protein